MNWLTRALRRGTARVDLVANELEEDHLHRQTERGHDTMDALLELRRARVEILRELGRHLEARVLEEDYARDPAWSRIAHLYGVPPELLDERNDEAPSADERLRRHQCVDCGRGLSDSNPSGVYCDELCQQNWMQHHNGELRRPGHASLFDRGAGTYVPSKVRYEEKQPPSWLGSSQTDTAITWDEWADAAFPRGVHAFVQSDPLDRRQPIGIVTNETEVEISSVEDE